MSNKSTFDKYSATIPGVLTQEDLANASQFMQDTTFAQMAEWGDEHTKTYELNGQTYRMVVDRPIEADESKAVVVTGEFGNGISPGHLARAQIIRDFVAPEATLVYQPNTIITENNMNYSRAERGELHKGNLHPIIGRIGMVLAALNDPEDLTFYGPSQGGTVSLGYAAHADTPAIAVAAVEPPNVVERSLMQLATDFAGCGAQLKEIVGENFDNKDAPFSKELLDGLSVAAFAKFVLGIPRRDNIAVAGVLRRGNAQEQIEATLKKGGSVVQAYGTVNRVSPVKANQEITNAFSDNNYFQAYKIEGADHSITNHYALNGAFTRAARHLMEPQA